MPKTALMKACETDNIAEIKSLLANNADIAVITEKGQNALTFVQSAEAFNLIVEAAQKKQCIDSLISSKSDAGFTAFDYACFSGNVNIVKKFFEIENFFTIIDARQCLNAARNAYWKFPRQKKEFDEICFELRKLTTEREILKLKKRSFKPKKAYFRLFKSKPPLSVDSKQEAIKLAIAQSYALLNSPIKCLEYLHFLNQEFLRYYRETFKKEFPAIDPATYKFVAINGAHYPIPKKRYKRLKGKNQALQQFLISLFRKHDIGKAAFKWLTHFVSCGKIFRVKAR